MDRDGPTALSITSELAVSLALVITEVIANRLLIRRNDELRRREFSEEVCLLNAEDGPIGSGLGRGSYRSFRRLGPSSRPHTPRHGGPRHAGGVSNLSRTASIKSLPSEFSMHRYKETNAHNSALDGAANGAAPGSVSGDDDPAFHAGLVFENPSFVESTRSSFSVPSDEGRLDHEAAEFQQAVRPGRLLGDGPCQLYVLVTVFCLYSSICNISLAMRRTATGVSVAEGLLIEVPPVILYYLTMNVFLIRVVTVSDAVSPPSRWLRRLRLPSILAPTLAVLVVSQVVFVAFADSPSASVFIPYPDCALATYLGVLLLSWGMKSLHEASVAVAPDRLRALRTATATAGVFLLLRAVLMLPVVQSKLFSSEQNEVTSSGMWTAFLWVPLALGLFFMHTLQAQPRSASDD